ncbi:MAG: putative Ig domain-containing protein [Spirochaetaceae bacterium]|nr:putative Ig domain-containing protein [Spirochaetaceae bacterium]
MDPRAGRARGARGPGSPRLRRTHADRAPTFAANVDDPEPYTVDEEITPLVLPAATGGTGALTYSLTPEIPGLAFETAARRLSGTPTETGTWDMTYTARDENGGTAALEFTIIVVKFSVIHAVVAVIEVGDATGEHVFADLPEPNGGPGVTVTGNHFYVAGGSVFLDVEPAPGTGKLLFSLRGASFGYYEVDLPDSAASQRVVGRLRFDLPPGLPDRICLDVSAVDAGGAVGPPTCHVLAHEPVGSSDVQVTVSWDSDADLDLHVADPNGDEVYEDTWVVESGGRLDVESGDFCSGPPIRNEHVAWTGGTPPPGLYEVRVTHDDNCDAEETNYVVSVYNHGTVTVFTGTFTGPGVSSGRGTGTLITRFQVGDVAAPEPETALSDTYRGSGDQVFVLNPNGEVLDQTPYTLNLGSSSPEVYVIATAGNYHVDPQVERVYGDKQRAVAQAEQQAAARPALGGQVSQRMQSITAFNNFDDRPPVWEGSADPGRIAELQARPAVKEGDRFSFTDRDDGPLDFTARRVATDGTTTAVMWVEDREWEPTCASRGDCVTQEMMDAVAVRFLRPGGSNDIYDWVTAIFGAPWGPHSVLGRDGQPILIPADAAKQIDIFFYDIEADGYPTGSRIIGYFWGLHNRLREPDHPLFQYSIERLAFFMDSPFLASATGDTWEIGDRRPSVTVGTLAHEFQHMIHFYQKPVLRNAISETWLNEQASEVAEDLIADKVMIDGPRAVAYDDPTAGAPGNLGSRLPDYNLHNDIQVTTWDGYLANYSIAYAFGAYVARNYGGAALFGDIVQSDRAGVGAIEGAIRNQGRDESFLDVLTNWGAANLLSDNTAAPAPYQYNTGTWRTSYADGLEFRLGSINLYNYTYARGRLARPGPYLHPLPVFNERVQPPHSNMYTTLGRNSGTLSLRVTAESDNVITVVVKE